MMLFKYILLCLFWFLFGIYTGIRIYGALKIVHIRIDGEKVTDEEIDKAVKAIKEKTRGEED